MIWTITRHEIRSQIRDGRFQLSTVSIATLLVFSVLIGLDQHGRLVADREQAQAAMRQQWLPGVPLTSQLIAAPSFISVLI